MLYIYAVHLNGALTLLCGVWLLYLYIRGELKTLPIFLWAFAFVFYGLEIFARIFGFPFQVFAVLSILMIVLFVLGLGIILRKSMIIHVILFGVLITALVLIFLGYGFYGHMIMLVFFYVTMTIGSVLIVSKYGSEIYPLLLGWTILLVSNLFLLYIRSNPITDINCSVAKVIFTLGARRLEFLMPRELRIRRYIETLKRMFRSR